MEKRLIMNTQYIDFYLQQNNMSKKDFAKKCDIELKVLEDIYEQKDVDIFKVLKIIKVLKIKSDTFFFLDRSYPKRIYVI